MALAISPISILGKVLRLLILPLLSLSLNCSQGPKESVDENRVDGSRILKHAEQIVSHGPHPPGSEAQRAAGAYIRQVLETQGLEVDTHTFYPVTPRGRLEMVNIRGVMPAQGDQVLILASHYDSKFFNSFEFVGANDGASSSGLVLELARLLVLDNPTDLNFWFVFFDGEEALGTWTSADSLYGSREFVEKERGLQDVGALILLDLVGGADLTIRQEQHSTTWLNRIIWAQAARMGHTDIFLESGTFGIEDDHIPFLQVGIPAVDLIDPTYAHWHKPSDTLDKLSGSNLEVVGEVVLASFPEIARELKQRVSRQER